MKPKILLVAGPTAVGKTGYAIHLAKALDGEIVSADSMQIYKEMNVGSAKPTSEERALVPHHLIDLVDPRQPISVAEYQIMAKEAIHDILSRGKFPIVSGGTGLYVNSLLYQMDFATVKEDQAFRQELEQLAAAQGNTAVHEKLQAASPETAERIHPNNLKKVIRALEQIHLGNSRPKEFQEIRQKPSEFHPILIGLTREREELYRRIDQRVDQMMAQGLLEEVEGLKKLGLCTSDRSMMGIGYKELFWHLEGQISLKEAIEQIKQASRNYAKRQLTWFRAIPEMIWFDLTGKECPAGSEEILHSIRNQRDLAEEKE